MNICFNPLKNIFILIFFSLITGSFSVAEEQNYPIRRDWASRQHYVDSNTAIKKTGERPAVVFFGDSITANWAKSDKQLFRKGWINRGISGQTTSQMLLRFRQDVVDLRPFIVHIMAGTNDVAGNTGAGTRQNTIDNIQSMVDLAVANGIKVVLGSIPPSSGFRWKPNVQGSANRIADLNGWLKSYTESKQIAYADYWSSLSDQFGGMRTDLSSDGTHPNRHGYELMRPIAENAIAALRP